MATTRTYGDACGIARALDVVGSRWALLVIRELLLGPLRFSDVQRALPGASTNTLADRLRELGDNGVVTRHRLPPPAGATVYELTDWGRELEPLLVDLGAWGLRVPKADGATISATSVLLFLRGSASPDQKTPKVVLRLTLDERVFRVILDEAGAHVAAGDSDAYDASLECDPATLNDLLCGDLDLDTARVDGRVTIDHPSSVQLLIDAIPTQQQSEGSS